MQDVAGGKPFVGAWLERRGLTFEEVANAVYPAVEEAARRYDPGHESGASFATFAMKYIRGEVALIAADSPPLSGTEEPEDRHQEEPYPEEQPPDPAVIVAWAREHRKSDIIKNIYEATMYSVEYSSGELRQMAEVIEEEFAEDLLISAQTSKPQNLAA